jgi:hypothetical protein
VDKAPEILKEDAEKFLEWCNRSQAMVEGRPSAAGEDSRPDIQSTESPRASFVTDQ